MAWTIYLLMRLAPAILCAALFAFGPRFGSSHNEAYELAAGS